MGDLARLIEAVERGEYHRENGPAKYLQFLEDREDAGVRLPPAVIADALYQGKDNAAAILRAMEAEGNNADPR